MMNHLNRRCAAALQMLGLCLLMTTNAGAASVSGASLTPGQLLTSVPRTGFPALPDAAENYLITYVSTSFNGRNTVVSGQVAIPKGTPPAGGFPVISFGYGTNGGAHNCAPSNELLSSPSGYNDYLNEWAKRGYVVLRTDYEAWGMPGKRPSGHGRSNANSLVDIVTAAHSLSSKLSNDWLVVGHSQGGGAVLWTTGLFQQAGGKYNLKGGIAMSPTGPGIYKFITDVVAGGALAQSAQPFIPIVALGAQAVDPSIDLSDLVPPAGMPLMDGAQTLCFGGLAALPQLKPGQYYKAGRSFDAMAKYVKDQDPSSLTLKVPVFVVQGGNDQTTVTPPTTQAMIKNLCSRGASIQYKEYPGESHSSVRVASMSDVFSFAAAALTGTPPKNACP